MTGVFVWAYSGTKANSFRMKGWSHLGTNFRIARWDILTTRKQLLGQKAPVVIGVGKFREHPEFADICEQIILCGGSLVTPEFIPSTLYGTSPEGMEQAYK